MVYLSEHAIQHLEQEAAKQWDVFYRHNQGKFFKDRHYFEREFPQLLEPGITVLEVGCGAGNSVFPLLEINPTAYVHACDFSPTAVDIVQKHPAYASSGRASAFVADLTKDDLCSVGGIAPGSVDVVTAIFVLSAISRDKMLQSIENIKRTLKPGKGVLLFRDYAYGDLAQFRFEKSASARKIADQFYARGDGTRAYFYTEDDVRTLFSAAGFLSRSVHFQDRLHHNRKRQIKMRRRWVIAVFSLDPATEEIAYEDVWQPPAEAHVEHFSEDVDDQALVGFKDVPPLCDGDDDAQQRGTKADAVSKQSREPCASDLLLQAAAVAARRPPLEASACDPESSNGRDLVNYDLGSGVRIRTTEAAPSTLSLATFGIRMPSLFRGRSVLAYGGLAEGSAAPTFIAGGFANPLRLVGIESSEDTVWLAANDFWSNRAVIPRLPRMLIPDRVRFGIRGAETIRGPFDMIMAAATSVESLQPVFQRARQGLLKREAPARFIVAVPSELRAEVVAAAKAEGLNALSPNGYEVKAMRAAQQAVDGAAVASSAQAWSQDSVSGVRQNDVAVDIEIEILILQHQL